MGRIFVLDEIVVRPRGAAACRAASDGTDKPAAERRDRWRIRVGMTPDGSDVAGDIAVTIMA